MFTIKSFSDVICVAKTFGVDALAYVASNSTLGNEANQVIRDCFKWAKDKTVQIESVNDGNNEYEVYATFERDNLLGKYSTFLTDITIHRVGFGGNTVNVLEAMQKGYINKEILNHLLKTIKARNEAATILAL